MKDYAFVVILARKPWLKANADTAKAYLRAVSHAIDWFYDKANRDGAIEILSSASKQDKTVVGKTYDYYADELMPFARKLALPTASVQNVATALGDLGILKSPQTAMAALDMSYAPK